MQPVSIVRLACMLKSRKYTSASIDGMNTDHSNGTDGWRVADWRCLRIIDAAIDPDRGWFNPECESGARDHNHTYLVPCSVFS